MENTRLHILHDIFIRAQNGGFITIHEIEVNTALSGSRRIVGSFDAGFAVAGLYHSPEGYGFAEGLYMTRREIFLLLDGGGKTMSGKRGGENGALVVLVRPRGF